MSWECWMEFNWQQSLINLWGSLRWVCGGYKYIPAISIERLLSDVGFSVWWQIGSSLQRVGSSPKAKAAPPATLVPVTEVTIAEVQAGIKLLLAERAHVNRGKRNRARRRKSTFRHAKAPRWRSIAMAGHVVLKEPGPMHGAAVAVQTSACPVLRVLF